MVLYCLQSLVESFIGFLHSPKRTSFHTHVPVLRARYQAKPHLQGCGFSVESLLAVTNVLKDERPAVLTNKVEVITSFQYEELVNTVLSPWLLSCAAGHLQLLLALRYTRTPILTQ